MRLTLVGVAAVVVLGIASTSRAQTAQVDVAAGYVYLHDQDTSQNFPAGWMAAIGVSLWHGLGADAEVGASYKTLNIPGDQPKLRVYDYMAGPRVAMAYGPVRPFAQVLFGGARATSNTSGVTETNTAFAWQPGGGIDLHLSGAFGVRLEGDYRVIRFQHANSKEARVAAAAIYVFGK